MKISDIARKLGVSIKDVRDKAKDLNFVIAQKSNTMGDKKAKEFIEAVNQENKKAKKQEIKEEENQEEVKEVGVNDQNAIEIPEVISVKNFSEKLGLPVTKVITELMKNGVMASLNENIDFETAEIVGSILGFVVKKQEESSNKKINGDINKNIGLKKITRPPVITIIGHVDHGKTKLLDYIRKTNVIDTESGGITQHIGAYQIEKKGRKVTFLDTPGHAAFSAMREHGVRITDVAVLVVAADDGVKPQTKESVRFAQEAGVPIVVAINKIDKPEANIEKTKRELADIGLIPEEWGGNTVMGNVSAKVGTGVDELLDLILLVADMKKIESYVDIPGNGFVIESKMSTSKGPIATVLIREGTLKIGDAVTIGRNVFGRIRSMTDYKGKKVKEAKPSDPVRITGLSNVPNFGEVMEVENSFSFAKDKIAKYKKESSIKKISQGVFSLSTVSSALKSGELRELRLIIKADVTGSLKAIRDSLESFKFEEVSIKIINDGIGDINDSDVKMAIATQALVLGFRVGVTAQAKKMLENNNMKAEIFDIIYELIDKVTLSLSGLLEPEEIEKEIGKAQVLKVFKDGKKDKIIGVRVTNGKLEKDGMARFFHGESFIAEGRVGSLRIVDKTVNEVAKGIECGMNIFFHITEDEKVIIVEGDTLVETKKEKVQKELIKIE
ncbi:MAG TPA: translation initiation factor IF-2 [Patescibacteria group bacterium]|nr:translation initiation factor IF-2 [Patescibacteria group bacterium]